MAVAGYSIDFESLLDAPSFKRLPTFDGFPSLDEASAVCFCCLGTDVPLTNAKKCSHKDFVNVYLSMQPSIPLLICNICHHMLKKIEDFRLQIEDNFRSLISRKEANERCMIVNNLSRRPTIKIISIKPLSIENLGSYDKDPLSIPTAPSESDSHDFFTDDLPGSPGVSSEEPTIKTELDENTPLSCNIKDTNMPGTTEYYKELKPTNNKEKIFPPPPALKGPFLKKKLNQSTVTSNNGLILLNPLKTNGKEIMVSNKPSKLEPTKQTIDSNKKTKQEILLNPVNKPMNSQKKYETKQNSIESATNCIGKVTNNDIQVKGTKSDIEKLMKNYDYKLLDGKRFDKKPNYNDSVIDENYKGKIGMINLTETEILKEREEKLLKESFVKNKYRCESCIETFQYDFCLDKHNERFHSKKNNDVECPICKRRYLTERTMEDHSIKHFVRYVCLVCNLTSKTLPSLTEHFNKTHTDKEPIKNYECEDCDFSSYYSHTLRRHRRNNHKLILCKICNKNLTGSASYRYHMKYCHDKVANKKKVYNCDECKATFASCGQLTYHKKTLHPVTEAGCEPTPVFCQPCNKFLCNMAVYKNHLKYSTAHSDGRLKFECDYCHKKCLYKNTLIVHIQKQHLKNSNLNCKICSKLFAADLDLSRHVKRVHGNKNRSRAVCDICGKDYCSKPVLKKHMSVHTGERPHACEICGMTFAQSSTLATHKKLKHKIPKKREIVKENSVNMSS